MSKLELYKDLEQKYDSKIIELRNMRISLLGQLTQAHEAFSQAIASELDPEQKGNARMTAKAKEAIEKVKGEIKDIDERLTVLEQLKQDKLTQLFPSIVKEFNQLNNESITQIEREAEALKCHKADFLLHLVKLHNMGQDAKDMFYTLQGVSNQLGIPFRERCYMPTINMTFVGNGCDKAYAPTDGEISRAYGLGQVELWIQWYAKTGDIVSNEEARQLLKGGEK